MMVFWRHPTHLGVADGDARHGSCHFDGGESVEVHPVGCRDPYARAEVAVSRSMVTSPGEEKMMRTYITFKIQISTFKASGNQDVNLWQNLHQAKPGIFMFLEG